MDFDSPDVEKDFPGLYASESVDGKSKKSKEESDYSEGGDHDKSKKDLLIGRRKDKKDKGKDRGYAALEGESSPEEEIDAKSPSKSKKSKAFKFTSSKSKEKRDKSPEKEKEKEKEHKKKEKENKEKHKKEKSKKSKQQSTASEEILELGDVQPVFGVSVSLATERSRCHDGINLPLVVRDCIDYLQEHALKNEQIYKMEPLKTRLQHYKRLYNNRERQPETDELDIPTACGLLKLFLRELPEPILTTDLIARFEEVAAHAQVTKQQKDLQQLLEQLPSCNKTLLCWILLHFDTVIQHEKYNKMNAQSLAMLLSPPLQMSHRLLVTLLCHCTILCADVQLIKYVPPITSSSPKLPEKPNEIQLELCKQESLLAQIHAEMNAGFASKKREEQLWEVQRIITQLKRKLRSFEKKQEKSIDELQPITTNTKTTITTLTTTTTTTATSITNVITDVTDSRKIITVALINNTTANNKLRKQSCSDDESVKTAVTLTASELQAVSTNQNELKLIQEPAVITEENCTNDNANPQSPIINCINDGLYIDDDSGFLMVTKTHPDYATLIKLQLENQELLAWKAQLQARIGAERAEILRLKQLHHQQLNANAAAAKKLNNGSGIGICGGVNGADGAGGVGGVGNLNNNTNTTTTNVVDENLDDGDYQKIIENFIRENSLLEHKKQILAKEIFEKRRECIALQVELAMNQFY